jgi:hypothetical protein
MISFADLKNQFESSTDYSLPLSSIEKLAAVKDVDSLLFLDEIYENGYKVEQDFAKAFSYLKSSQNPLIVKRKFRFFFRHLDEIEKEDGLFKESDFLISSDGEEVKAYQDFYKSFKEASHLRTSQLQANENDLASNVLLLIIAEEKKQAEDISSLVLKVSHLSNDEMMQSFYIGKAIYDGLVILKYPTSFELIVRRLGCVRNDIHHGNILNALGSFSFSKLLDLYKQYQGLEVKGENYQNEGESLYGQAKDLYVLASASYHSKEAKTNLLNLNHILPRLNLNITVDSDKKNTISKTEIKKNTTKISKIIVTVLVTIGISLLVVGLVLLFIGKSK